MPILMGSLDNFFSPSITAAEHIVAQVEGWISGVA
jgi:hypothetical protein